MSQTRSVTEYNIRLLIDDLDPGAYAISSVRMHQYLQGQMQLLSLRMVQPMEAVTTVNILSGTYDYTLTGTVADVRQVLWNATGQPLEPASLEDLNALYHQDSASAASGIPEYYALYETSAQASKIRVAPTPNIAGSLKLYYGIVATALAADSSTIPFSAPLLRILERKTAAECLLVMSEEDRQKRMVGGNVARLWNDMAERSIQNENWRMRVQGGTQDKINEVSV